MNWTLPRRILPLWIGLAAIVLAGCITVGHPFPKDAVDLIKPGITTLDEIRKIFGDPVRTGMDDGKLAWTYIRYHASILGDFDGEDLVIKFDPQNKVASVGFNSTDTARPIKR
jgi:hypothetical protein